MVLFLFVVVVGKALLVGELLLLLLLFTETGSTQVGKSGGS